MPFIIFNVQTSTWIPRVWYMLQTWW